MVHAQYLGVTDGDCLAELYALLCCDVTLQYL